MGLKELVEAAKRVGMKIPANPESFLREEAPHFFVFLSIQDPTDPWADPLTNSEVIMGFSEEEIVKASWEDLLNAGLTVTT